MKSVFAILAALLAILSGADQPPDPYTEHVDWESYGTVRLYPSVLSDIEDASGTKFARKEAGEDKLILGVLGGYVWTKSDAGAFGVHDNEAYCWVVWHEVGHTVAKSRPSEFMKYCDMIWLVNEPAVSRYAMSSCHEDFAESYAAYHLGAELSPSRKEFIRGLDELDVRIQCDDEVS